MLAKLVGFARSAAASEPPPEAYPGRNTKYRGLFCTRPWEFAQINPDGAFYPCCPQHLNEPIGNMLSDEFMESWNSPRSEQIRASILDGTFRYCNENTCGMLQERNLPTVDAAKNDPEYKAIIENQTTRLARAPRTINMSYDLTCNLSCPSCRTHQIILKGEAREPVRIIHDKVMGDHLRDAEHLIVTGSGDPFQSRLYLQFLRNFRPEMNPGVRIHISTNGILLTREMWESICHDAIESVDVSVDAASAATYALNRGGDFAKLLVNLRFLGELRRDQRLNHFELHFVVQQNNFREMAAFLALGRDVNCDKVCFKQLVNWGTFTAEEYTRRAVQFPGHPEHGAFLDVLKNPVFREQPGRVSLHDLTELANTVI
jgi:MoaA/NifB/PqqE/SkfB family radical SAM enzyme